MYWFQLQFVKRHLSFWSWFLPDSEWISRMGARRQSTGLPADVYVTISGFPCLTRSGSGAVWKSLNGRSCSTSESSSSIQVQNTSTLPQSYSLDCRSMSAFTNNGSVKCKSWCWEADLHTMHILGVYGLDYLKSHCMYCIPFYIWNAPAALSA